jgi:hypothetical protein
MSRFDLGSKGAEESIQESCYTEVQTLLPMVDQITEVSLRAHGVLD